MTKNTKFVLDGGSYTKTTWEYPDGWEKLMYQVPGNVLGAAILTL